MSSPSIKSALEHDSHTQLIQLAFGYMPAACLYAAAKLKVADLLANGPKSVSELARECHANEDALHRILRVLATVGVFRDAGPQTFANTPLSEAVRSDIADSARDTVLWESNPSHMRPFAELMHSIRTGQPAFKKATGLEPFEYLRQNPEDGAEAHAAMTSISAHFTGPAIEAYDFGESGTLADIGGGHGILLTAILQKHRGLRGIVFDLPHVVEGAKPRIEELGLASRCEVAGGDFFEAVPPADSYIMKSVIHDWDDNHSVDILRNCAKAMRNPNGKVILVELVISPSNDIELTKWVDVDMLVMLGGRERTEAEFSELFRRAGLRLANVIQTPSVFCVIEAAKNTTAQLGA